MLRSRDPLIKTHVILLQGKRDFEIAILLGISQRTIHHHVARLLRKLGVDTRSAAALY
jgi:DNA-binding CsgD family transcriptional regulator